MLSGVARLLQALLCVVFIAVPVSAEEPAAVDFTKWESIAKSAEEVLVDGTIGNDRLNQIRADIVKWRQDLTAATGSNAGQIETIRTQINALGPLPAEGASEDPAIASRRQDLNDALTALQAPGLAATEAATRADGVVRNIDRLIRERQTDQLMSLSPTPFNPANWESGWVALMSVANGVYAETQRRFSQPINLAGFQDNGPLIAILVIVALILILRGGQWMSRLTGWMLSKTARRGRELITAIVSVGQVVLPVIGALMLTQALKLTTLFGPIVTSFFVLLPAVMIASLGLWWIGARIFPADDKAHSVLGFTGENRAQGQFLAALLGVSLALQIIATKWITPWLDQTLLGGARATTAEKASEIATRAQEATSVFQWPLLLLAGVTLFRLGQLVRRNLRALEIRDDAAKFQLGLLRWTANVMIVVGVAGPVLGAIGYISAANALVWPTVITIAVLAVVVLAQNYFSEIYAVATHSEDRVGETLFPVLMGCVLVLAALPLLAMVWGARPENLLELWTEFRAGFQVGGVRLSPSVFLTFVIVFVVGYTITRLFQGALRTSILPKTSLDRGGQNAIVSGIGYLGIFLAALLAISVAGIDLSSLAIVAGALSVGVGFGLQTIVQNFVSGIILLIERPISEGDWIKVGQDQGIVKAISVRSTRIEAFDRSEVVIPNATLITGQVTNLTRTNSLGRSIVMVSVAYGSDTRKISNILKEIAENQPLVMMNPAPTVLFTGFGADGLNFEVRMILSDISFGTSVQSEVNHQIYERFRAEKIEIPFAQRDLWLRNPDIIAESFGKVQDKPKTQPRLRHPMLNDNELATNTVSADAKTDSKLSDNDGFDDEENDDRR